MDLSKDEITLLLATIEFTFKAGGVRGREEAQKLELLAQKLEGKK